MRLFKSIDFYKGFTAAYISADMVAVTNGSVLTTIGVSIPILYNLFNTDGSDYMVGVMVALTMQGLLKGLGATNQMCCDELFAIQNNNPSF